ncbi:hypothetical protein EUGRSUZ_G00819 [Eucalyptus grandis]|uniref:Uncharacterized protein n=2 Tax=Eucalyptus grandis TaxID=71139 RepID=A0ACC3K3H7_EUCGR|nr:hypothetical protein EUGRSUZ_G00819 [Eucalyptus grandis]
MVAYPSEQNKAGKEDVGDVKLSRSFFLFLGSETGGTSAALHGGWNENEASGIARTERSEAALSGAERSWLLSSPLPLAAAERRRMCDAGDGITESEWTVPHSLHQRGRSYSLSDESKGSAFKIRSTVESCPCKFLNPLLQIVYQ